MSLSRRLINYLYEARLRRYKRENELMKKESKNVPDANSVQNVANMLNKTRGMAVVDN